MFITISITIFTIISIIIIITTINTTISFIIITIVKVRLTAKPFAAPPGSDVAPGAPWSRARAREPTRAGTLGGPLFRGPLVMSLRSLTAGLPESSGELNACPPVSASCLGPLPGSCLVEWVFTLV